MFGDADIVPGYLALATMTRFFASPEEGAPSLINGLNNTSWEEPSTHGVREHRGEDGVDEDQAAAYGKATTSPPREAHVAFGHDGCEVAKAQFIGGERKSQVCLGEGGYRATEGGSHRCGDRGIDFNGHKGALMEVYGQTSGSGEVV
jgi:hypothetical protein